MVVVFFTDMVFTQVVISNTYMATDMTNVFFLCDATLCIIESACL